MPKFVKIGLWCIGEVIVLALCWLSGAKMGEILGNILFDEE